MANYDAGKYIADLMLNEQVNMTNIATHLVTFAFEGFDIKELAKVLFKLRKDMGDPQFQADLELICSYFLTRGTGVTTDALKRLKPEASAAISDVIARWKIVTKKPQTKEEISIARIISVFPVTVMKIIMKFKDKVRLTGYDQVSAEVKVILHDGILCFPQAAALIPAKSGKIWAAFKIWNDKFSEIAKAKWGVKSNQPPEWFITQARQNSLFTEEQRIAILGGVGFTNQEMSAV